MFLTLITAITAVRPSRITSGSVTPSTVNKTSRIRIGAYDKVSELLDAGMAA